MIMYLFFILFSIIIALISNFSTVSGGNEENLGELNHIPSMNPGRSIMIINHYGLYKDYLNGYYARPKLLPEVQFTNYSPSRKKEMCKKILDVFIFQPRIGNDVPKGIDITPLPGMEKKMEKFYRNDFVFALNSINISAYLGKNYLHKIQAFPCYLGSDNSVVIADGYNSDVFFLFTKPREPTKHFGLVGLIQPSPVINEKSINNQKKLEMDFVMSLKPEPDREPSNAFGKKSFCGIKLFERLRLCSAAFVAWNRNTNEKIFDVNYVTQLDHDCVKNTEIHFKEVTQEEIKSQKLQIDSTNLKVELFVCTVNEGDSNSPQIFLIPDQVSINGAYVLKKFEDTKFTLEFHIERLFTKTYNEILIS